MTTLAAHLSQITVFTSIVRGTENRMFVNIKFNEKNATQIRTLLRLHGQVLLWNKVLMNSEL